MPAAAVIPAPIAYIKVVAVKKLVVGLPGPVHWVGWLALTCRSLFLPDGPAYFRRPRVLFTELRVGTRDFYFEKIRVFKAGSRLNTLAWNNGIGLWSYFVGF